MLVPVRQAVKSNNTPISKSSLKVLTLSFPAGHYTRSTQPSIPILLRYRHIVKIFLKNLHIFRFLTYLREFEGKVRAKGQVW